MTAPQSGLSGPQQYGQRAQSSSPAPRSNTVMTHSVKEANWNRNLQQTGIGAQVSQLLPKHGDNGALAQLSGVVQNHTEKNCAVGNSNLYANLLGMANQSTNASLSGVQQNHASFGMQSMQNHYHNQSAGASSSPGRSTTNNFLSQLAGGLEPTPLPSPHQNYSPTNTGRHFQGQEGAQTTGQDFFSPTPIHPNHQLSRPYQHQGIPQSNAGMYQQMSQGNRQPYQGFNPQMGQFFQKR